MRAPVKCQYHPETPKRDPRSPFAKIHEMVDNREFSPAAKKQKDNFEKLNISRMIMLDPKVFGEQAELYRGEHKKFLYKAAKCKVGSRADRVYNYYAHQDSWNRDRYLVVS